MKILKNLGFIVFVFLSSCVLKKPLEMKNNKSFINTNYGKFLSASYSIKNGDADYASKTLDNITNFNNQSSLIELAFYSNVINGKFVDAQKLKEKFPIILDKNSFQNIPSFAITIKKNKLIESIKILNSLDDLPGLKLLLQKIKYLGKVYESKNVKNLKLFFENINNKDIYDLIIFEKFKFEKNTKTIETIMNKNQTDINTLLIAGYLNRNNLKNKQNKLLKDKLSYQFDTKFILQTFKNKNNIFLKKPSANLIVSSYLINLAQNLLHQKKNIPISYIKMLLEISAFISPNIEFSNFYLGKIYDEEYNYHIALEKLSKINESSLVYLPALLKKYHIFKEGIKDEEKTKLVRNVLKKNYFHSVAVKYELAHYYRKNNQCNKALKIYDKLLFDVKDSIKFLFFKASCLEKIGLWNESKTIFQKIIDHEKDAYSLNYLSYSMAIRNENLETALMLINQAIEMQPNNGYFLDTLGWIQYKQKNYYMALKNLQRAVVIQPNSAEIMDHLGDCYFKIGRTKEAIYEWKRALQSEISDKLKKIIKNKISTSNL